MKSFVSIPALLLILYLVGTNGRHVEHENDPEESVDAEEQSDSKTLLRDHTQMRHRRRPRQMHPYDYPQPFYYDNRRDYNNRQQEEYLWRIMKSLDEIISIQKRPPPPPQPIYIPYPVVQYSPCICRPQSRPSQNVPRINETTTLVPELPDRFPVIEDDNQLWMGSVDDDTSEVGNAGDGSRPISLVPVQPSQPTRRPPPPVDHGTNQAGMDDSTAAPAPARPGKCEIAILMCCGNRDKTLQRNCFEGYNCGKVFASNRACLQSTINLVLEKFSKAYAPVKKD